jgi:hypothetical protein
LGGLPTGDRRGAGGHRGGDGGAHVLQSGHVDRFRVDHDPLPSGLGDLPGHGLTGDPRHRGEQQRGGCGAVDAHPPETVRVPVHRVGDLSRELGALRLGHVRPVVQQVVQRR